MRTTGHHQNGGRLEGLTGLRAVAALWVLSFHYSYDPFGQLGAEHLSRFAELGYLGVDQFFILSGFVIWHVHGRELARPTLQKFNRFLGLRFARIYPVHLFTLMLFLLLWLLRPMWGDPPLHPGNYTGQDFALNLALVQAWGFTPRESWNYPSWSVSAEWFCYLLFPFLAIAASRLSRRGALIGLVLLLLGIGLIFETLFSSTLNHSLGGLALVRAASEFCLGCLLRRLSWSVSVENWPWTYIVAGCAAFWGMSFATALPVELLAIFMFAAITLAASVQGNLISRFLSLRPVVAVGAASYSLYLMQAPVEKGAHILRHFLSPHAPFLDLAVAAGYFVPLAVGATLVHLCIENPSRRLLRRWIDARLPHVSRPAPEIRKRAWADAVSGRQGAR